MSALQRSSENITGKLSVDVANNLFDDLGVGDVNTTDMHITEVVTCADNSEELAELKVITLLVVGGVGAVIVGCLLFCMLYKNERILQSIPGTKQYKRKKAEPKMFFPIPRLAAVKLLASQGAQVGFVTDPVAMEMGKGGAKGKTKSSIKRLRSALSSMTTRRKDPTSPDTLQVPKDKFR